MEAQESKAAAEMLRSDNAAYSSRSCALLSKNAADFAVIDFETPSPDDSTKFNDADGVVSRSHALMSSSILHVPAWKLPLE